MIEEETNKGTENPDNTEEAGDKSEADKEIERVNAETERINKAIAENDNAKARQKMGGVTVAGQQAEKPKAETPKEYARRVFPSGFDTPQATR